MAEKTRRIAEFLLRVVPCGARLPVGAQVNVRVAFMQAGGAGAKYNRDALATIFRYSVINLRLELRQRRQQDLIVARAVRSEFSGISGSSPSTPARTACGCPCNQPARGRIPGATPRVRLVAISSRLFPGALIMPTAEI